MAIKIPISPLVGWAAVSRELGITVSRLKTKVEKLLLFVDLEEEESFSLKKEKLIVFDLPRFKLLLRLPKPGTGIVLSDFCWAYQMRPSTAKALINQAINDPDSTPISPSDFYASKSGWRILDPQDFLNKVVYG